MAVLRPVVIAAVLRKDFQSLWLLVLTSMLLPLYVAVERLIDLPNEALLLIPAGGMLATLALAVVVIHQDALTSSRHDWMTRPIGVANLVVAKVVFVGLTIAAPLFLGSLVNEVNTGSGLIEALVAGVSFLTLGLYLIIPVFVLGLVTGSLLQAGVAALGLTILQVVLMVLFPRIGSDPGTRWILDVLACVVGLVFCVAAVVVLFTGKRAALARLVWGCGAVAVLAMLSMVQPSVTVALQQQLAPGHRITDQLVTSITDMCIDPAGRNEQAYGKLEGRISPENLASRWVVNVDQSHIEYETANGKRAFATSGFEGADRVRNMGRLLSGYVSTGDLRMSDFAPRTKDVRRVHWYYDISLLEPGVSRDLPIDGQRRYLPDIGYCDATRRSTGNVEVDCFKPFGQPATIDVRPKNLAVEGCFDCDRVDYRPAVLDGFGASRSLWLTDRSGAARVLTLTPYEARGHVSRRSITPVPTGVCPKRNPEPEPVTLVEAIE